MLLTLLGMIPGVAGIIQAILGKWMDTKANIYATKMGVTKDVAISAIQAQALDNQTKVGWLNAVAGSRFLQLLVGGFAAPLIIFMGKSIVWDNIIHKFIWDTYGFTPPLTGFTAEWAGVIISGIFVTSTGLVAAGAYISKANKDG